VLYVCTVDRGVRYHGAVNYVKTGVFCVCTVDRGVRYHGAVNDVKTGVFCVCTDSRLVCQVQGPRNDALLKRIYLVVAYILWLQRLFIIY
jgi:hypothetical protein